MFICVCQAFFFVNAMIIAFFTKLYSANSQGENMPKKRILWVSDSPSVPSGNGKITRNFVSQMNKYGLYEVAVLGRGYFGWPGEHETYGCVIYPMDIGRSYPELMRMVSDEFHPQVVISCLDMWQIDWIEHAKLSNAVTNIGYISIYGSPAPLSWKKVVKNLDLAVCYSDFGKNVLKEFMPFTSIDMIPLGVDPELYRPLDGIQEFKVENGLKDKFVVGNISRNQIRKRLDKLIEGFAIFAEKKDDVRLFMKTEAVSEHGYDLPDLLQYYGVEEKTIINEHQRRAGYNETQIVEILNSFDVYTQTAGAEGFGMPILEAMSCGVPVIAPDYSACSELVKSNGIPLRTHFPRIVDMASVEQVSIDTSELAGELDGLYKDREKRAELGKRGRVFARNYSWDSFGERWHDVLSKVRWE